MSRMGVSEEGAGHNATEYDANPAPPPTPILQRCFMDQYGFHAIFETKRNYVKLPESIRNLTNLSETRRNYAKICKTTRNDAKLSET